MDNLNILKNQCCQSMLKWFDCTHYSIDYYYYFTGGITSSNVVKNGMSLTDSTIL